MARIPALLARKRPHAADPSAALHDAATTVQVKAEAEASRPRQVSAVRRAADLSGAPSPMVNGAEAAHP